ncbi:MAG: rhodanese-related sulfurtransferase [Paracoccaceae bacterium]|jgi:rhodanese-related sulfurtransferase
MSVENQSPSQAWQALSEGGAALVDVRTNPEWAFVGLPDLSSLGKAALMIEWRRFPDMSVNGAFLDDLTRQLGATPPEAVYFICRSGARSYDAASAADARFAAAGVNVRCINVAEGFEGDLDPSGRRGHANGWKAHDLPWRQS